MVRLCKQAGDRHHRADQHPILRFIAVCLTAALALPAARALMAAEYSDERRNHAAVEHLGAHALAELALQRGEERERARGAQLRCARRTYG
jgi:hypothetical protein